MMRSFLLVASLASAAAFTSPTIGRSVTVARPASVARFAEKDGKDSSGLGKINFENAKSPLVATATAAFWAAMSSSASAAGPDWGIFEGKTLSLLHPAMMASMFALSASTALLGFQWRRQRTIGGEISDLKATLPDLAGAKSVASALATAQNAEEVDSSYVMKLQSAIPIEKQIADLQAERKELSAKGPRDRHYAQGAWVAFLGTVFAIEGPLNTYARTGKLFPGPHLYAGAGLVCLWALAVACVPAMQKGDDTARTVHIGANVTGMAMFAWQIVSGWPILLKVWEKAPWP